MKVTKLIREYVEEQVSKVYDSKVNPYTEQAERDYAKLKDFEEYLKQQQKETIAKFLSENELFTDGWGGAKPYDPGTSIPRVSYALTKAMMDKKKWEDEIKAKKKAKIREIMLSLELGANRQELEDMISKLMMED